MANPLFGPEIRLMLREQNDSAMHELCDALHPATVAEALHGDFSIEEASELAAALENPLDVPLRIVDEKSF